jgi:predicted RNase H-like HicB family nuclease
VLAPQAWVAITRRRLRLHRADEESWSDDTSRVVRRRRNAALQPRRLIIVLAAVGCKRLLGGWIGWYIALVTFTIELEPEADGRWLAEISALPGVMCYGADRDEVVARVQALALRVIAERLEHREAPAEFVNVTFQAA